MAIDPFSTGAGFFSNILNFISQANANDTNLQIAREANQNSRQIAKEQNDWNYWMWQQQNAYNDPSAQVARLKAAGINPGLAYANGNMMNEAAPAAPAAGADVHTSRVQPYFVDPLTMAQIANINANTEKTKSETRYQDYVNAVEEALAHSPISSVTVTGPDGNEVQHIEYGNLRVEMTKQMREALGLQNQLTRADFAALVFDVALLTGSDSYAFGPEFSAASDLPGYDEAKKALQGDRKVRDIAGQLADISLQASQAEKAGREAYAKWLKEHEDDPVVKFALTLQGFLQTLGISLPRIGSTTTTQGHYGSGGHYVPRSTRSWFFGGS